MKLKTWIVFLGAIIAIGAVIGVYFGVGVSWIGLGVVVGAALLSYVLGAVGAAPDDHTTGFGEFMRGWLVGFNAALNALLAMTLVGLFAPILPAALVGTGLGLLGLLCVFSPISQGEFYQGVVGWTTWLMPMSWLVVGLGLTFYLICLLGHAVTAGKVAYLRVEKAAFDWKTATFFLKGGLISNMNPIETAFNMGNFAFIDYKSTDDEESEEALIEHEAGHTLNLAAFGSLFHLIGALDENVLRRGVNAFSERLAESNVPGTAITHIPMWA